jgi:hypothetical protein
MLVTASLRQDVLVALILLKLQAWINWYICPALVAICLLDMVDYHLPGLMLYEVAKFFRLGRDINFL